MLKPVKKTTKSSLGNLHYSGTHELINISVDGEQRNRANIYSFRNYCTLKPVPAI
jgi:hypothetical protein